MRSYDEYCAVAKSLDMVGDRWTLLLVRELALGGPRRYTDLRNGLPGIATNLLAERLRELERVGVVAREEAPPPIATTLFRLTPRGEELRPVIDALTRWGIPLMYEQKPTDVVRSEWLAWALERVLSDQQPEAPAVTIEIQTGDQPFVLETNAGHIQTHLGPAESADATISGPPLLIMGTLLGLVELDAATAGGVSYEGDPALFDRLGSQLSPTASPG